MGLSFERVIKNLQQLHRVYEARGAKFAVYLTRVGCRFFKLVPFQFPFVSTVVQAAF